jgi:hypothetical protein
MNHSEAVEQKATERYLLGELSPEARDAFEEHAFDCTECTLDLRVTTAFLDEAKLQLPQMVAQDRPRGAVQPDAKQKRQWFSWFTPAFAVPSFALLLIIVGYQNLALIPSLREAASAPQILPWSSVHVGSRGAAPEQVAADPKLGALLMVDLPRQTSYASYSFELYDAQGKRVWKSAASTAAENENGTLSLLVHSQGLHAGSYSLAILGNLPSGETTEIGRRAFDITFSN